MKYKYVDYEDFKTLFAVGLVCFSFLFAVIVTNLDKVRSCFCFVERCFCATKKSIQSYASGDTVIKHMMIGIFLLLLVAVIFYISRG